MQFVKPILFQEAIDKLGSKSVIGSQLNSEQWAQIPTALRERAFFSSTIENVRFLQRAQDSIGDFLSGARHKVMGPDGIEREALKMGSRADFVKQMSAFAIAEGMGPLDSKDKGGLKDITSQKRLNLIFDVQTQSSTSFGNWKQGMDPSVLDEFPAQRFIREVDVKQPRPVHQQNEGVVRLKTDLEFWTAMNSPAIGGFGVPWGPWGFGSGMTTEDVDRTEAEALGLLSPSDTPQPVDKDFNEGLEASLKGLDPEMVTKLQQSFGSQVEIDSATQTARWSAGVRPSAPVQPPSPAPAAPVQPATPRPASPGARGEATIESVLKDLGLEAKPVVTAADMANLREELKEAAPAQASTVLGRVKATASGALTQEAIAEHVQEFLNFLPASLVEKLPKLDIRAASMSGRGSYSMGGNLKIDRDLRTDPDQARRTMFHELMHWVHREGSPAYQKLIKDHFDARTAGEPVVHLGNYRRDVRGKRDKWYEVYAGRIYRGEYPPMGLEVPTRYIEWLTMKPNEMARWWNDPDFRETMKIVLKGLF